MTETITVTGIRAHLIEEANRASFYGINGNSPACIPGRIAAENTVRDHLKSTVKEWNSFYVLRTRTVDTSGTPIPYKAEIDFIYD